MSKYRANPGCCVWTCRYTVFCLRYAQLKLGLFVIGRPTHTTCRPPAADSRAMRSTRSLYRRSHWAVFTATPCPWYSSGCGSFPPSMITTMSGLYLAMSNRICTGQLK